MNELQKFYNEQFGEIRIVDQNGETWFVAKDVCDVLGIKNVSDACSRLKDNEKNTIVINDSIRGNPNKTIISESGLYKLIMLSRKPEAEAFQDWISEEVLPEIRKTGGYVVANENDDETLILARGMQAAGNAIKRLESEKKQLENDKKKLECKNKQLNELVDDARKTLEEYSFIETERLSLSLELEDLRERHDNLEISYHCASVKIVKLQEELNKMKKYQSKNKEILYTIKQVAAKVDMTNHQLNKLLEKERVIVKDGKLWKPTDDFKEYFSDNKGHKKVNQKDISSYLIL